MDRPDEHQQRWIAQKRPAPVHREAMKQVAATLVASIQAALKTFGELVPKLTASDDFAGFYTAVDRLAELSRSLAGVSHYAKTICEWTVPPMPEFADHFINQFYLWPELKRTFWLEGAVMCSLAMKQGGRYLELCCGSGFYTDMFYASIAREVVAVDFDPRAIELARRHHGRENVRYQIADIRDGLPDGPFDGVLWDAAIEHFSSLEIAAIMTDIKRKLVPDGMLSGYTIAESGEGLQHPDHEQEFNDMDDLAARLRPHFKNVLIFESLHQTIQPPRHNLFFYASDGTLPFDADWPHARRF